MVYAFRVMSPTSIARWEKRATAAGGANPSYFHRVLDKIRATTQAAAVVQYQQMTLRGAGR